MEIKTLPATKFLALLLISATCFGCGNISLNPLLEKALNASDDREFNHALVDYGTLQNEDVPAVVKATKSSDGQRRKNAAWLLKLCRQASCGEAQVKVVRETNDVMVWAILVETASRTDEKVWREKPDLLNQALASEDGELLAPALRVALKINHDGIQEKILKLLDSRDSKVLEVVLNNLSPALAKQEAARLARMLDDDKTYGEVEMEIAMALVRAEDARYYPNLQAFVGRLKKERRDHNFFNAVVFSEDKQAVDLLWKIARMKDGEVLSELRDQAYDALTRRVWAPDMREPVTVELMEMTLNYLRQAPLDTNPRAHFDDPNGAKSASYLIAFLNKGNTDFESFLFGKDAIAFAEKWLSEHKQSNKT